MLEAVLHSRTAAITTVVIEDREALRQLLRQAVRCPRIRQTLMHFVASGKVSCAERRYAQSRQDRSQRQDRHHQPSRANVTIKDDSCGRFIDQLRAHLLRLRVGGLSKHDFFLAKEVVELKAICREFCANHGLRHVFRDLWGAVGTGRKSYSSSREFLPHYVENTWCVRRSKATILKTMRTHPGSCRCSYSVDFEYHAPSRETFFFQEAGLRANMTTYRAFPPPSSNSQFPAHETNPLRTHLLIRFIRCRHQDGFAG